MSELSERILSAIARADSKRPARAADVAAQVGGSEAEFWAALETLTHSRQINSAHVMRPKSDPEPWLAIWPTGVVVPDSGWTGDSHRALFEAGVSIREAMHASHAPRVRASAPAADQTQESSTMTTMTTKTTPARGASQAAVLEAMYQSPSADMSCSELAAITGFSVENVYGACQGLIRRELLERVPDSKRYRLPAPLGEACAPESTPDVPDAPAEPTPEGASAEPTPSGMFQAELLRALEMLEASPEAPVPANALAQALNTGIGNVNQALRRLLRRELVGRRMVLTDKRRNGFVYWPVRSSAPHEARAPVRIGLWDDGSLTIVDGDDVLQYPPDVTERIARLLGVPHPETYQPGV